MWLLSVASPLSSCGIPILDKLFLSNFALGLILLQTVPYMFLEKRLFFDIGGLVFVITVSLWCLYIMNEHDHLFPHRAASSSTCLSPAGVNHSGDDITLLLVLFVQRMVIDIFQIKLLKTQPKKIETQLLFHHGMIIVGMVASLHWNFLTYYVSNFIIGEVSTIFMNLKSLMFTLNIHTRSVHYVNNLFFALTFLVFRVGMYPWVHYTHTIGWMRCGHTFGVVETNIWILESVVSFSMTTLSYFWFFFFVVPKINSYFIMNKTE